MTITVHCTPLIICAVMMVGALFGYWSCTPPIAGQHKPPRVFGSNLPSIASFSKPIPRPHQHQMNKYYSQIGQDKLVDNILNGKTNGFFVESGAYDGVAGSNSLYFELNRGWKGLLIEANPHLYRKIIDNSNRNATVIHAGVSPLKTPTMLSFRLAGPLGGFVNLMSTGHEMRIAKEIAEKQPWMLGEDGDDIQVHCWPLHSMLQVLGVDHVDYWSLDTEGSEAEILKATDFDAIDVRVLTVEVNDLNAELAVKAAMSNWPRYRLHSKIAFDLVYVKES